MEDTESVKVTGWECASDREGRRQGMTGAGPKWSKKVWQ